MVIEQIREQVLKVVDELGCLDSLLEEKYKNLVKKNELLEHQLQVAREQEDELLSRIEKLKKQLLKKQPAECTTDYVEMASEKPPTELEWDHHYSSAGYVRMWSAIPFVNSHTFKYKIRITSSGLFSVAGSDLQLFPMDLETTSESNRVIPEPFTTLGEAKKWCQQNEINRMRAFEKKGKDQDV